ncbi:MAG: hypothetical protein ACYS14_03570, partial [Planctomycetota bacterium]
LGSDIGEKHNLTGRNPEEAERLQRTFDAWKSQLAPSISRTKRQRRTGGTPGPEASKKRNGAMRQGSVPL